MFSSTWSFLFVDIFDVFLVIRVQRIAKITPFPELRGNIGPILLAREGCRFEANRSLHGIK